MGLDRKYTDRDVRHNPQNTYSLVEAYLADYQGEFEFLVDCKMRVASNVDLSIGMLRGVLNCMRVDPRYRGELPQMVELDDAEVIPMPRTKRKKYKEKVNCPLLEADIFHHHKISFSYDSDYNYCYGLYRINRSTFELPATLKTQFVKAKSLASVKIHKAAPEAFYRWMPNPHGYGWRYEEYNMSPNELHVKNPNCIGARWLTNPILLSEAMIEEHNESVEEDLRWEFCHHCWKEE